MKQSLEKYYRWLSYEKMPKTFIEQLEAWSDDYRQIDEAFYKELEFGTSGLRGIMGPGSNRMNQFVVAKVSVGLSNYINKTLKDAEDSERKPKVIISYDSRKNSYFFAVTAAEIFSAMGIEAYIFEKMLPVSLLSYGIRYMDCDYGIMITASHNSKEYNGYKVYGRNGGQILPAEAKNMQKEIEVVDIFDDVPVGNSNNVIWLGDEIKNAYVRETVEKSLRLSSEFEDDGESYIRLKEEIEKSRHVDEITKETSLNNIKHQIAELKVCYSPLNGTGRVPVTEVLKGIGVEHLYLVPEQEFPDEEFTTCPKPNPEEPAVYEAGIRLMKEKAADILIVTDPDCDRIGVATEEGILTGNQLAILLFVA